MRRRLTYNPALLTADELVSTFVVREVDLELALETIRDNDGPSNQHLVVVGARGMGKTTLACRVAVAVERDPRLRDRIVPVLFGEEAYDVGSVGELWLKALERLADEEEDERWQEAHEAIRGERDEQRLRERALGRLLDYAHDHGCRLLLVIENLDTLLGEQLDPDDGWTIRHALQQHSEIMLLGTALSYDEIFGDESLPLYGLAREHRLEPLTLAESRRLWLDISGEDRSERAMIPIHRLTGGNTRLITIVASFAAGRSFRELMDELTALIDEHTTYFKALVDSLPPAERRVYATLADIWAPATSRDVADRCRMSTSKASALIARLASRGMVEEVGQDGRSKRYQLTERLYNVYHLLRSRGGQQRARLMGLVEFMSMFYESDELLGIFEGIAREVEVLGSETEAHLEVCKLIIKRLQLGTEALAGLAPPSVLARIYEEHPPSQSVRHSSSQEFYNAFIRFWCEKNEDHALQTHEALARCLGISRDELWSYAGASPDAMTCSEKLGIPTELLLDGLIWPQIYLGGWMEVLHILQRLSDWHPTSEAAAIAPIAALADANQVEDSNRLLEEACTRFASSPTFPRYHGSLLCGEGRYSEAVAVFRRLLERRNDRDNRLSLASALAHVPGGLEEARLIIDDLPGNVGNSSDWLRIATAEVDEDTGRAIAAGARAVMVGDLSDAVEAFAALIPRLDPASVAALVDSILNGNSNSAGWLLAKGILVFGYQPSERGWQELCDLLGHPLVSSENPIVLRVVTMAVFLYARADGDRALRLLEERPLHPNLEVMVVALRLLTDRPCDDVPAEVLEPAREFATVIGTLSSHLEGTDEVAERTS